MWNKGFAGWYFKHQRGNDIVAFIPGRAKSGAFIQMMENGGTRQFAVRNFSVTGDTVQADNCLFSPQGCSIDLPGVQGVVSYGKLSSLKTNIMGPFCCLPMQCRHGIVSMAHSLDGSITIDGRVHGFTGGAGYIEKDSGTSFPRSYQWLQCNDFEKPCSLMVSIAHIPFVIFGFTGCICAVLYDGTEYRFATYNGVRIHAATQNHIILSRDKQLLHIEVSSAPNGHPLASPVQGSMTGIIRESCNVGIRAVLIDGDKPVFDLSSKHATYEYVPRA